MRVILLILTAVSLLFGAYTRDAVTDTVYDDETSLTWQDEPYTQAEQDAYDANTESGKVLFWNSAIDYCENLDYAGVDDWRLPNKNELLSITDLTRVNPAINPIFVNVTSNVYWSSTTYAGDTSYAWHVDFINGLDDANGKDLSLYVRCVRSGQIAPLNTSPVARDDSFTTSEDTSVSGNVITKATADSDPEGDALHVSAWGTPAHGSLSATNNDGSFTYTLDANYNGTDSFQYTLSDGSLEDNATVQIEITPVNDTPTAVNDTASTYENTMVSIDVLANDSDIENDTLSLGMIQVPSHGSISPNGTAIEYTPEAGYVGSDSFEYQVSDGNGGSANAVVNITIERMDEDGVDEPSGVDGNHDGVEDRFQSYVVTQSIGSSSVTIASLSETTPLSSIGADSSSANAVLGADDIVLPYGTLSFSVTGLSVGGVATIELYYPYDTSILGYAKEIEGIWYEVSHDVEHNAEEGYTKITLNITDGSQFDLDGTQNGEVRDPGGAYAAAAVSAAAVSVPLSPFAKFVMMLLFAFGASRFMRRR